MVKVLFLLHDLGQGGAEKVLVNLVNNMDLSKFDISVIALFGGGVNEQFLRPEIKYRSIFSKMIPGNSYIMKLFSPKLLHKVFVKETYDIEISYLEGPSARIIAGCENKTTKLVSWIHCTMQSPLEIALSFKNLDEAESCYNTMDKMIFVSEEVREKFLDNCNYRGSTEVMYNTVESDMIIEMSKETVDEIDSKKTCLVGVGTLKPVKGFDRMLRIVNRLHKEAYPIHLYILGTGPQQRELEQYIRENELMDVISLLGYKTNPYKYVAQSSMLVCSSLSEGFSTAVTESLIVGTPVCTVNVSGMKEMLGNNNEFGLITDNTDEALYRGIKCLLDDPTLLEQYKVQARERGEKFKTEQTVKEVENMLLDLMEKNSIN